MAVMYSVVHVMYYNLYYRNANVVGKIDVWQKGGYKKVSKLDFES